MEQQSSLCKFGKPMREPRGGGGVLWYFHTYLGSGHFWGIKILIFNIFGVFRKINIFWGMKILWIFFGSSQNWTIFRGHFYSF